MISCHTPHATRTSTESVAARLGSPRVIGSRLDRRGEEIVVCGQLFHVGTPVVLFNDSGGYDAYKPHAFFSPERVGTTRDPNQVARFGVRRNLPEDIAGRIREEGWRLEDLARCVSQVVVHYDVAGTSWNCFKVLHDVRGLSCHFLLDVDGTIYQTLDLKERAWHAGVANDASIGIEIAHMGARTDATELRKWYPEDDGLAYYRIPRMLRGRLPKDYVGVPARPGLFQGQVHGKTYFQYDFTEAQYEALESLVVALVRIFPDIDLQTPTDDTGQPLWSELPDSAMGFRGVIGHYHITVNKQDPGPAFDWRRIQRCLDRERAIRMDKRRSYGSQLDAPGASGRSK